MNAKTKDNEKSITMDEWQAEGIKLFGPDHKKWKFVCPSCGHVASVQDWKDAGASPGEVAFSCIGRRTKGARDAFKKGKGPCNYAGGGLFRLNTKAVEGDYYFEFAEPTNETN